MINKEKILAMLAFAVEDTTVDAAFEDSALDPDDDYVKENARALASVAVDILQSLLTAPDVTEGGYSIHYDKGAVKDRMSFICTKYGLYNPLKPTVTAKRVW